MQTGYFDSYSYDTPVKEKLNLTERLRLNNRLYFIYKYAIIVLKSRKQAKIGMYGDKEWEDSSFYIFRLIEKTGGKFHISGMENIAKSPEPVLFIGNHMSTLETMILPGIISPLRRVTFVVKESLVKHPLFGDVMRSRDPIVVGRTDPRKDFEAVMDGGMELLSKGISIIIFPQSTRSLEFRPEDFNSLGVKLAKKAGVKVVPVALKTDFWGNGKIVKELGPIDRHKPIWFKFGEPFPVSGNGKEENQKIIDFIKSSLKEWENNPKNI
ncbi:MAG: 1-acyl-sn-glycerol-3-phosphate acyltransferase [Bacteroidales bacterium]|jgi:1-acyl-sn-glycerol-3-phosphate acyltransferase|nr:1-acyl-sn-glycerol-3-phosphate acyltransferase [Bacteroidales bacterium]